MIDPLVSVILPLFNGERFLEDAVNSVRNQTYLHWELIAVDDGSADGSASLAEAFPDVRLIRLPHGGVARARNAGVEAASGDLISFIDQDDTWEPEKLELQVRYLLAHPEKGFVLGLQKIELCEGVARPSWLKPELLESPQKGYLPSALLVRRAVFERVGLFNTCFETASDSDWFFRAKDAGMEPAYVPRVLVVRSIHRSNQSNSRETTSDLLRVVRQSMQRQIRTRRSPMEDGDDPERP